MYIKMKLFVLLTVLACTSVVSACRDTFDSLIFDYSPDNGPDTWPARFADSCNGTRQSPVALNLPTCSSMDMPLMTLEGHLEVKVENFTLINTATTAEVVYPEPAPTLTIQVNAKYVEYTLEQVHLHWGAGDEGSEHHLDQFYGMEGHLVHFKSEYGNFQNAINYPDGLIVLAVMFEITPIRNPELETLVELLSEITKPHTNTSGPGDLMQWLREPLEVLGDFVTYEGSLTTPPCSEVVTWVVLTSDKIKISRDQISKFRELQGTNGPLLENRRELQEWNERKLLCSNNVV